MALPDTDPAAPAAAASPGDGRLMRWFNRRGWSNLIIGAMLLIAVAMNESFRKLALSQVRGKVKKVA